MRKLLLAVCLAASPLSAFAQEAEPARAAQLAAERAQAEAMARAMAAAQAKADFEAVTTKLMVEAQAKAAAIRAAEAARKAAEEQAAAAGKQPAAAAQPADAKADAEEADPIAEAAKKIPAAKREKLEKLMGKMKLQEAYEAQVSATFQGMHGMMKGEIQNMPQEMQKNMRMGYAAYFQFMKAALEWNKVKDRYLLLYAKHFSEEELTQTLALLERPEAQLLIKKQMDLAADGEHGLNKVQWDIFQANMKEAQQLLMNAMNNNGFVGGDNGVVEFNAEAVPAE